MSLNVWIVLGVIMIVIWAIIGWEAWNSPISPADYNETGINPDHERLESSNNEKEIEDGV